MIFIATYSRSLNRKTPYFLLKFSTKVLKNLDFENLDITYEQCRHSGRNNKLYLFIGSLLFRVFEKLGLKNSDKQPRSRHSRLFVKVFTLCHAASIRIPGAGTAMVGFCRSGTVFTHECRNQYDKLDTHHPSDLD